MTARNNQHELPLACVRPVSHRCRLTSRWQTALPKLSARRQVIATYIVVEGSRQERHSTLCDNGAPDTRHPEFERQRDWGKVLNRAVYVPVCNRSRSEVGT